MFGFFRTTEALEFADLIIAEYDKLHRSIAIRDDTKQKRIQKFEKLLQKIHQYVRGNKLNFYQKSRMILAIKDGLIAKGYERPEIDGFLDRLLVKGLNRR